MSASLGSIQTGSATMAIGDTTVNVAITAIVDNRTILKYTYKVDGDSTRKNLVRGTLTSTTNILFDRVDSGSTTAVTIQWEVIYHSGGTVVQRGTVNGPGGTQNIAITASPVSTTWVLLNYRGGYNLDPTGHERMTAELTTTTNLQTVNSFADAWNTDLSWQVIRYNAALVALVKRTHVDTATEENVAITSVNRARTAIFPTIRSNAGSFALSNGERVWLAYLEASNNLRFVRGYNNGGAGDGVTRVSHVFIVTFPDVRVSRYTQDIDSGSTSTTKTITALLSTSKSSVNITSPVNYVWPYATEPTIPHKEIFINMVITNTTTITLSRAGSGHQVTVYWEMLEWDFPDGSKGFFMFFEPF